MYVGAEFRKADLQVHSPRDRSWRGKRPDEALRSPDSAAVFDVRVRWSNAFIDACIAGGLGVVAITDHHEGVYIWSVIETLTKRRSHNEEVDLWLLPGMELTARDSAQALVVFDADLPRELFEKARSLLNLPTNCHDTEPRGIEVEPLSCDVEQLDNVLDSDDELRGRFIVLPNVTPGGYKTMLRRGFHARFRDMPYVGGYLDATYPHELSPADRRILDGEIPAWNSQRLGLVCTSDARDADFSRLGDRATWLKLARPTAESLRQALLAANSRISYEPPELPSVTIGAMKVVGSAFIDDYKFLFNPQFTAFIGGRGAGKSTLLEYLRFALGRSALDEPESPQSPTKVLRQALLESTLTPVACVAVTLTIQGATVMLTRSQEAPDRIRYDADGVASVLTPSNVRQLVTIQTFSQGELSHVGGIGAESRLLDLLGDSRRREVDLLHERIVTAQRRAIDALWQNADAWTLERRKTRLDAELRTLKAQAARLRKLLESAPEKARATIDSHGLHGRGRQAIDSLLKANTLGANSVVTALRSHAKEIQARLDVWQPLLSIAEIAQLKPQIEGALQDFTNTEEKIVALRDAVTKSLTRKHLSK